MIVGHLDGQRDRDYIIVEKDRSSLEIDLIKRPEN
jgi:hypothetical protein